MRVIFVCTGNICRSTTAEAVLRHKAAEVGLDVFADSAGVSREEEGNPPDRRAVKTAASRGYQLRDSRARKITDEDFRSCDLIFGMTQRHVGRMIQMAPPGDVGEMKLFMDFVAGHEGEDVPDPWYGVQEGFELTLNMIELGVDRLVKDLKD